MGEKRQRGLKKDAEGRSGKSEERIIEFTGRGRN